MFAAVALAAAAPAVAATPSAETSVTQIPGARVPSGQATPGRSLAPARLFLSPSGEPFRQGPQTPDPLKAWFDQADAGHAGYIDRAAFRADAARFFKRLDENGDGVIDGFEVADYEAKIAPELAEWAEGRFPGEFGPARGQRSGGGERDRRQAGAPGGQQTVRGRQRGIQQLIDEPEPVSGADFRLDSHITLDEWMRAADQRFDILDANKDGRLTLDELRARFLPLKK
jgi:hypothetical protein